MGDLTSSKLILPAYAAAARVGLSTARLCALVKAGKVMADYHHGRNNFFLPESLPRVQEQIEANRQANWKSIKAHN